MSEGVGAAAGCRLVGSVYSALNYPPHLGAQCGLNPQPRTPNPHPNIQPSTGLPCVNAPHPPTQPHHHTKTAQCKLQSSEFIRNVSLSAWPTFVSRQLPGNKAASFPHCHQILVDSRMLASPRHVFCKGDIQINTV